MDVGREHKHVKVSWGWGCTSMVGREVVLTIVSEHTIIRWKTLIATMS